MTSQDTSPRRSPLHDAHAAAGATFTDFAGYDMPVRYGSDRAEHQAVRTAAGLFDLSHMAEIAVSGADAGAVLDYALAGRLSAVEPGRAKYSLLLDENGGILDDLVVYRDAPDRYLVVANAANRETVVTALGDRASGYGALVDDESDRTALVAVQGPASAGILAELAQSDRLSPGAERSGGLRYYRFLEGSFDGVPVRIARTGYTGEDGFELYLDPTAAPALWEALLEVGAGSGLVPCGLASRDSLRLEAGMPLYGHELSRDIRPEQAGLGRVVDLTKDGDFVGRAALGRGQDAAARRLVGLEGTGRRAARADYPVQDPAGGGEVGRVTSGGYSPTLDRPIAMAYVDPAVAAPGTALDVDIRGTATAFTVTELPFYTRKKK